jgi:hypothetical protein
MNRPVLRRYEIFNQPDLRSFSICRGKTGVPQTVPLYIQKIVQRIKKRPTDKACCHLIKLYAKTEFLNPLVVFQSVGHKKI